MNPLEAIDKINECLNKIMQKKNISNDASDIFLYYSKDFCLLLSKFYPSSTIMVDKTYKRCSLLINGVLYNSKGIVDISDYKIANEEELNFVKLGLNELSEEIYNILSIMLDDCYIETKSTYVLRKNSNYLA